jgi:hypothetical protein
MSVTRYRKRLSQWDVPKVFESSNKRAIEVFDDVVFSGIDSEVTKVSRGPAKSRRTIDWQAHGNTFGEHSGVQQQLHIYRRDDNMHCNPISHWKGKLDSGLAPRVGVQF